MGGLHSGRKRQHTCITDCIELDLAYLRKHKMLVPGLHSLTWGKWTITNFNPRQKKERSYELQMRFTPGDPDKPDDHPRMTLYYQTGIVDSDQTHNHKHTISFTTTPCNYGGSRWWFRAPCCGARVRVLYINPKGGLEGITPQCRNCLELHYASQVSSYIERHKTYERYLLANYGLTWAANRYDFELKEHYLTITPELEAMRLRSQYEQHMKTLRLLLSLNRFWRRQHTRALDSLRSEDDRWMYTIHILKEWGPGHVLEVAQSLRKPEARQVVEEVIAAWIEAGEKSKAPLDLTEMIAMKEQLEEDLQALKAA